MNNPVEEYKSLRGQLRDAVANKSPIRKREEIMEKMLGALRQMSSIERDSLEYNEFKYREPYDGFNKKL